VSWQGRTRSALVTAAKLGLAAAIFWWLLSSGRLDPEKLGAAFEAHGALVYAIGALGLVVALGTVRWWLLLRAVDLAVPFRRVLALGMIGHFFNTFLPGGMGGDAMRVVYITREAKRGERLEAATTVFIDRLFGLTGLGVLLVCGCLVQLTPLGSGLLGRMLEPVSGWLVWMAGAGGVCALAGLALLHPRVRGARLVRAVGARLPLRFAGLRMLRTFLRAVRHAPTLAAALGISVVVHATIASVFVAFGRALGDDVPTLGYAVIVPLGMLVNTIPGPPQGLGVGEFAFDALFRLASGRSTSVGTEVCLAWRLVANAWNMVGGVVYVFFRGGPSGPDPEASLDEPAATVAGAG
jgi:uncharacterized membrane protein YbhN (UPF0104 family)